MFSTYKRVFWLSVVMSLFMFVPFCVTGFSTDVWTRMTRITEWANAGFPWHEQLMTSHNYPFGFELHWTRPLDVIGYAFAWPFIPEFGLKKALEIMSCFVPILVMLIAVRGFFFGIRGYLTPKMAFFAFWLFFYETGWCWGQAVAGYFDHHIFQFALLVWVIALIARSFLVKSYRIYTIPAGILTAIGTWMTVEFFLAVYFCLIPFLINWFVKNKTLKPAIFYTGAYTFCLFLAMLFDHPINGFLTLDFYRTSLFHVLLGSLTLTWLIFLSWPKFRQSIRSRLAIAYSSGIICILLLIFLFGDIILVPTADPFMYHVWMKKVTEMRPCTWKELVVCAILPIIVSSIAILKVRRYYNTRMMPLWIIGATGTLFYSTLSISHTRFGLTQNAFFIFLMCCYLKTVFFPKEHSFYHSLLFIIFYLIFIGTAEKGDLVINRFQEWGINHYLELYKKDPTLEVPDYLKEAFNKALQMENNKNINSVENQEQNTTKPTNSDEDSSYSCTSSKKVWDIVRKDKDNGAIMTDIFEAPQILWETGKPVLAGPYHPNTEGITDFFFIQLDRPPYHRAYELIKKHKITQIFSTNPECSRYLLKNTPNKKPVKNPETTFLYAVYHETKDKPNWLKLEYHDKASNTKLFRVIESK